MTDERLILAIGRLERALSRLEAVDLTATPMVEAQAVKARHARLRESTQAAIARLDDLLGPLSAGGPR